MISSSRHAEGGSDQLCNCRIRDQVTTLRYGMACTLLATNQREEDEYENVSSFDV
jgi:hypothetical protein